MKSLLYILLVFSVFSISFCGSQIKNIDSQFRTIQDDMSEIKKTNSMLFKKLQDLDNRILLIEDEIDTFKIARQNQPKNNSPQFPVPDKAKNPSKDNFQIPDNLPVVKIQPDGKESANTTEPDSSDYQVEPSQNEITFDKKYFQELDENGNIIGKQAASPVKKAAENHKNTGKNQRITQKISLNDEKKLKSDSRTDALNEYNKAYSYYLQHDYLKAFEAFRDFASANPLHSYADNSLYWAGECLYDMQEYDNAVSEFKNVLLKYPDGNKVPDALLKIGLSYSMLGNDSDARKYLNELIKIYPSSEAGLIASRILSDKK
jgi:tol-pal system protein YbgF